MGGCQHSVLSAFTPNQPSISGRRPSGLLLPTKRCRLDPPRMPRSHRTRDFDFPILLMSIRVLLSVELCVTLKTYLKGAPFYNASCWRRCVLRGRCLYSDLREAGFLFADHTHRTFARTIRPCFSSTDDFLWLRVGYHSC